MGFRNPATTATAVDTGRGLSDAGVRLYQDRTFPAVPQGVAEWRTGLMARNATIKLSGGASGGSAFTFDGGQTSDGTSAPTLGLDVESSPTGGYRPVARVNVAWAPLVDWTSLTINSTYFGQYDPTETTDRNIRGILLASGLVVVQGMVKVNSVSFGAGATIAGPLPVGMRPARTLRFDLIGWNNAVWRCDLTPAGLFTWGANGPGTTSAIGNFLDFTGINFPAEQ